MAENKFSEWVERHEAQKSRILPITHVTSTISAERIIDENKMFLPDKSEGEFKDPLLYFSMGGPRTGPDQARAFCWRRRALSDI